MRSFEEYKELVDSHLTELIPAEEGEAEVLAEAMKYSLSVGGKRLRPVLMI